MSTLIRPAQDMDLDALLALAHRTINVCYRPFLSAAVVEAFLASGAADQFIRTHLEHCLVSVRDGQVVGLAIWQDQRLELLMIDPANQRQGLGTALLQQVEAQLGQPEEAWSLESFAANQPANAFYRQQGWEEVRRYFDPESGVPKLVFRKVAGPTRRGDFPG